MTVPVHMLVSLAVPSPLRGADSGLIPVLGSNRGGSVYEGSAGNTPSIGSCVGRSGNSASWSNAYKAYLRQYWEVRKVARCRCRRRYSSDTLLDRPKSTRLKAGRVGSTGRGSSEFDTTDKKLNASE